MGADVSCQSEVCATPGVLVGKESIGIVTEDLDLGTPSSVAETATPPASPIEWLVDSPRNLMEAETVIIFDWDDTLLCSSALQQTEVQAKQLDELVRAAQSALHAAMGLGEVLIVTNGRGTWVHDSASRFMPGLLPTLAKLRVVSARALFEHMHPGDPYMWKQVAFKQLLTEERSFPTEPGLNLVALGDQQPEIDAASHAVKLVGGSSMVKTIKFKESPTVAEIIGQLSRVEQDLPKIVSEVSNYAGSLCRRSMPIQWDKLASCADGWKCTSENEYASGLSDVMAVKDLWKQFF